MYVYVCVCMYVCDTPFIFECVFLILHYVFLYCIWIVWWRKNDRPVPSACSLHIQGIYNSDHRNCHQCVGVSTQEHYHNHTLEYQCCDACKTLYLSQYNISKKAYQYCVVIIAHTVSIHLSYGCISVLQKYISRYSCQLHINIIVCAHVCSMLG